MLFKKQLQWCATSAILGLILGGFEALYAEQKITVGYVASTITQSILWVAKDAGFLRKHGIDGDLVLLRGGVIGMQALIAQGVDFVQIGAASVVQPAAAGADVVILASTSKRMLQDLVVKSEISQPEDLRNKTLGITGFGSLNEIATRLIIRQKLQMEPLKDVRLLAVGSAANRALALHSGQIAGALVDIGDTYRLVGRTEGLRVLFSYKDLDFQWEQTNFAARRKYVTENPDTVKRFLNALSESFLFYRNPANAIHVQRILKKYLNQPDKDIDFSYRIFASSLEESMAVSERGIQRVISRRCQVFS